MKTQQLDYANTCPIIDKAIACACDSARETLERYTEMLFPFFDTLPPELLELVRDWSDDLILDIERPFEIVRETNEDMRFVADSQIARLCEEITELENERDASAGW